MDPRATAFFTLEFGARGGVGTWNRIRGGCDWPLVRLLMLLRSVGIVLSPPTQPFMPNILVCRSYSDFYSYDFYSDFCSTPLMPLIYGECANFFNFLWFISNPFYSYYGYFISRPVVTPSSKRTSLTRKSTWSQGFPSTPRVYRPES
jgi:hypothetical protein